MIYITGDTHANQKKWFEQIHPLLKEGDMIIVTGDFGVGFWNGIYWSEEMFYDWIAEQDYTVLFVDGNHCNFDKLNSYPVEKWNGGKVHFLRKNLIHLMRGEIYEINGEKIFTFGGGYSLDKYRRVEGESWWSQEMPSEDEYKNAEDNLKSHNYRVNYIITHTCPSETVYYLSRLNKYGIKKNVIEEYPLTGFLDHVYHSTSFQYHYFGHFHVDEELWRNQIAVFNSIREMKTSKIIHQWTNYEG